MKKILIVIDMQNDFINGSLGTKEAVGIVDMVVNKIKCYPSDSIIATRDTHPANYLETQEGKHLPVEHCIKNTYGWELNSQVRDVIGNAKIIDKPTFGSTELVDFIKKQYIENDIEIELVGLCTDICVVSNALLLKAAMPEVVIKVDSACCAGVTPETHSAAISTMKMCQIEII